MNVPETCQIQHLPVRSSDFLAYPPHAKNVVTAEAVISRLLMVHACVKRRCAHVTSSKPETITRLAILLAILTACNVKGLMN